MRLIVQTQVGDGYTFSCVVVRPVQYESAEALLVHLEEAAKAVHSGPSPGWTMVFAGHEWSVEEFGYWENKRGPTKRSPSTRAWVWGWDQVEIMTVDEWFDRHYRPDMQKVGESGG